MSGLEKTVAAAKLTELTAQATELGVSTERQNRVVGNETSFLSEKSTKFIDVKWVGEKNSQFVHLTLTTDAGETCTLSNLSQFGVPVSECVKADLVIEKSNSQGKLKDTFVLKGTRSFNNLKVGTQMEQAVDLLERPFTSEGIDCHVGGFYEDPTTKKMGFPTAKACKDALKVKTIFQLTFK